MPGKNLHEVERNFLVHLPSSIAVLRELLDIAVRRHKGDCFFPEAGNDLTHVTVNALFPSARAAFAFQNSDIMLRAPKYETYEWPIDDPSDFYHKVGIAEIVLKQEQDLRKEIVFLPRMSGEFAEILFSTTQDHSAYHFVESMKACCALYEHQAETKKGEKQIASIAERGQALVKAALQRVYAPNLSAHPK